MISTLGWADLASRRKDLRLALFYKVVFGLLAVPTEDILLRADYRTRASHGYKYSTIRANTEPYRQSFFPRTIPEWNILPPSIAEAPSIDILRHALTHRQPPLAAAQSAPSWWSAVSNSFPPPRFPPPRPPPTTHPTHPQPPSVHTPSGGLQVYSKTRQERWDQIYNSNLYVM